MANGMLYPNSPCTVTILPGDEGGITAELHVPTYSGGVTLALAAERGVDGDWVVSIPWLDDMDQDRTYSLVGNIGDVANGIAYLGAPDVPVPDRPVTTTTGD